MPGETNFDFLTHCHVIPHQGPLSYTVSAQLRASHSVTEGDMV